MWRMSLKHQEGSLSTLLTWLKKFDIVKLIGVAILSLRIVIIAK